MSQPYSIFHSSFLSRQVTLSCQSLPSPLPPISFSLTAKLTHCQPFFFFRTPGWSPNNPQDYNWTSSRRPSWQQGSFGCSKCGKSYTTLGNLSRHDKYECGKAPGFLCAHCSYTTYYMFNMQRHQVVCRQRKCVAAAAGLAGENKNSGTGML